MKLNVAAALFQSEHVQPGYRGRVRLIVSLVLASLLFFSSGAVMAADEVDAGETSPEAAESEDTAPEPHALATAIASDNVEDTDDADEAKPTVENATWENSRQIAVMSAWTEGDGYWGPAYHEDEAHRVGDTEYDR